MAQYSDEEITMLLQKAAAVERERCAKIAEAEYERALAMTLDGNPEDIAERILTAMLALR